MLIKTQSLIRQMILLGMTFVTISAFGFEIQEIKPGAPLRLAGPDDDVVSEIPGDGDPVANMKTVNDYVNLVCGVANKAFKTSCTAAEKTYIQLQRRMDVVANVTNKMMSQPKCGYRGILEKLETMLDKTEEMMTKYMNVEAKACMDAKGECHARCINFRDAGDKSTSLNKAERYAAKDIIRRNFNRVCFDPPDPHLYASGGMIKERIAQIQKERADVAKSRASFTEQEKAAITAAACGEDDPHTGKMVELLQSSNNPDVALDAAAGYIQRVDNAMGNAIYAQATGNTTPLAQIWSSSMANKDPYNYAVNPPAGLATDTDTRAPRPPSPGPGTDPKAPPAAAADKPSALGNLSQKDLQKALGTVQQIAAQQAAPSNAGGTALKPPEIPITDCSRDPSSPQCCIPGSGNCNRYDPNQQSARAKGPNAGESESGGSASAPAPLEEKKKSSIAEMLAALTSSVTKSSALPADPGNSGVAESGGSGSGKQAGAKAAKKVGGTSANDEENQVYNGRMGSPKAVAGAYPKEKGSGGLSADGNSKAALADAPAEPVNYLAFLPRGLKRRIMGAQGHPEIAGKFENLFENLNRAYRNNGPTLGPAVIQLSAIDLK